MTEGFRTNFLGVLPHIPPPLRHQDRWHMGLSEAVDISTKDMQMDDSSFASYQSIQFTRRLCTVKYKERSQAFARHRQLGGDAGDKCFRTGRYWCFYRRA